MVKFEDERRTARSDRQRAAMPLGRRLRRIRGGRACVPSCIMPSTPRRFPPPWSVEEYNDACFVVRNHDGGPNVAVIR